MKISIITPTYKRNDYLKRLYGSLAAQQYNNLEWIIINDGGDSDTEELINQFKENASFNIKYIYKENGGKHTAMNVGIAEMSGDIAAVVDDDDYFLPNVFNTIVEDFQNIISNKNICGVSYLCVDQKYKLIGRKYPKDFYLSNYIQCRINQNIYGDKIEFFKGQVLREYHFPIVAGEKFVTEAVLWIEIAKQYQTTYVNRCVLVKDYTSFGITANWRKTALNNPGGMALYYKAHLEKCFKLRVRIKYMVAYISMLKFLGERTNQIFNSVDGSLLFALCIGPGLLYSKKWEREFFTLKK